MRLRCPDAPGSAACILCICSLVRTTSCGYVVTDATALLSEEHNRIVDDGSSLPSSAVEAGLSSASVERERVDTHNTAT